MHLTREKLAWKYAVLLKMKVRHLFHFDVIKLHMHTHSGSTYEIVDQDELSFFAFGHVLDERRLPFIIFRLDPSMAV